MDSLSQLVLELTLELREAVKTSQGKAALKVKPAERPGQLSLLEAKETGEI